MSEVNLELGPPQSIVLVTAFHIREDEVRVALGLPSRLYTVLSYDPPLIMTAVPNKGHLVDGILKSGVFCVNLLEIKDLRSGIFDTYLRGQLATVGEAENLDRYGIAWIESGLLAASNEQSGIKVPVVTGSRMSLVCVVESDLTLQVIGRQLLAGYVKQQLLGDDLHLRPLWTNSLLWCGGNHFGAILGTVHHDPLCTNFQNMLK
jgi:flavin reductase (DIM6/NTAB) family NADH-FMN oxidoreductase RutF